MDTVVVGDLDNKVPIRGWNVIARPRNEGETINGPFLCTRPIVCQVILNQESGGPLGAADVVFSSMSGCRNAISGTNKEVSYSDSSTGV